MLNDAIKLFQDGKLDEAEEALNTVLAGYGPSADAYEGLARIAGRRGEIQKSAELASTAASLPGASYDVFELAGMANKLCGNFEAALSNYEHCRQLKPGHIPLLSEYADVASSLGRHQEAEGIIEGALKYNPRVAALHYARGRILGNQGRYAQEIAAYQAAIAVDPRFVDAYINAGVAYRELGQFEDALSMFKRAINIDPQCTAARNNRAQTNLLLQRFEHGWIEYEWRWRDGVQTPPHASPPWLGAQTIAGKTLLIHAEQGFGDTLQFIRYVLLLLDSGAELIVQVQPLLVSLIAAQLPGMTVKSTQDSVESFDHHVPLMSLPLALFKRERGIPSGVPYIQADEHKVVALRERFRDGHSTGLRVGLVWSGSRKFHNDVRVARLSDFVPILDQPCWFVSLQKDVPDEDAPLLASLANVQDCRNLMGDFSDTAALLATLDVIITIDTAIAHLAGAMGLEVWTLLATQSDWRWHRDHSRSAWYPTMSLFRQSAAGDWTPVVQAIAARLRAQSTFVLQ